MDLTTDTTTDTISDKRPALSKKSLWILLLDFAIVLFILVGKYLVKFMKGSFSPCIFNAHGFKCPSCGGTRCVESFLKGDFISAFHYNQYFFLLFIYVALGIIALNAGYIFKLKPAAKVSDFMFNYKVVIVWAILIVPFSLLRLFGII